MPVIVWLSNGAEVKIGNAVAATVEPTHRVRDNRRATHLLCSTWSNSLSTRWGKPIPPLSLDMYQKRSFL
jgi:hypothetical protein